MKFTPNFYARILGSLVLAYVGYSFGVSQSLTPPTELQVWATSLLMLCGAALGLVMTPYLVLDPIRKITHELRMMDLPDLITVGLGILVGLLVGVLTTFPLSRLPGVLGQYTPAAVAIVLAYLGAMIASTQKEAISDLLGAQRTTDETTHEQRTLVDTSVIVDGRIARVAEIGFIRGTLVVPRFVLHELQQLADSSDELTRSKGKRGLDFLQSLQTSEWIRVAIDDTTIPGVDEVDDKLVTAARAQNIPLLTNDMNLHHVAQLQGVRVLNLNQLADAVRLQFNIGDRLQVVIRNEGREREQGVGFSDDGTMIVVEDARRLVGQEVAASVTRVYTTQSGRIIFAQLERGVGGQGSGVGGRETGVQERG